MSLAICFFETCISVSLNAHSTSHPFRTSLSSPFSSPASAREDTQTSTPPAWVVASPDDENCSHSYLFVPQRMAFADAEAHCASLNSSLASVHSAVRRGVCVGVGVDLVGIGLLFVCLFGFFTTLCQALTILLPFTPSRQAENAFLLSLFPSSRASAWTGLTRPSLQ